MTEDDPIADYRQDRMDKSAALAFNTPENNPIVIMTKEAFQDALDEAWQNGYDDGMEDGWSRGFDDYAMYGLYSQ